MDFEEIDRPPETEGETLLCCENNTNRPKTKVRLFYSDNTKSAVVEVDRNVIAKTVKEYCVWPNNTLAKYRSPLWHFLKVTEIEPLKIMMGLMEHRIQTTPTHAAKLLGNVTREQIENLIAEGLLQTSGGNVWLDEVKKRIDEGYIGGMRLVR